MLVSVLVIFISLLLLAIGADQFVNGAAKTSRYLGLSPFVIGLVVVGLATSTPEILTSATAAWQGRSEIAIGNALGSNIANIGLILGISILLIPPVICSDTLKKEFLLMVLAMITALLLLWDRSLDRIDALILITCLFVFSILIIWMAKKTLPLDDPLPREYSTEYSLNISPLKAGLMLLIGLLMLLAGAKLLVWGAVTIAKHYGVSDLIIGLTIVAVGTSLPELATSIIGLLKKEADLAIGNIIGSNMYNMLAVIGIPGMIQPVSFSAEVLWRDFSTMMALTALLGGMLFLRRHSRLSRIEGGVLLSCFIYYQYMLYTTAAS